MGGPGVKETCEVILKDLIETNKMLKTHEKVLFLAGVVIF